MKTIKTIHKFPFELRKFQMIGLPDPAAFRHVGLDPRGTPCLWCEVNAPSPDIPIKEVSASDKVPAYKQWPLWIIGTGHEIPEGNIRHLGTFVKDELVLHVYSASELP